MSILEPSHLDTATRGDLIARAEALGIDRADVLTRVELVDEIVKRTVADPIERRLARGLLGVARDLVARVVERGLHLPDAAALIRGLQQVTLTPVTPPIATVTLAEIYAGQGHRDRALTVLDEVLANEPDHGAARTLRDKIASVPEEAIATLAPPGPPRESAPPFDHDGERDADRNQDRETGLERDSEGIAAADLVRDTLPPAADFSPTMAPDDAPPAGNDVLAADVETVERTTDIAPPFAGEVDRVVLVPVDATSALARWEIRQTALDQALARAEGGELILRIVAVTPSWEGPNAEVRDIAIAPPTGAFWVCDLPPSAVLRAAVGWRGDKGFDPLAVALDVVEEDESATAATIDFASSPRAGANQGAGIEERARRQAGRGKSDEGPASSSWRALALAPWEAPPETSAVSIETH